MMPLLRRLASAAVLSLLGILSFAQNTVILDDSLVVTVSSSLKMKVEETVRIMVLNKDGEDDADNDESQRGDDDANGGESGDSEKHEVDVGNPQYDGRDPSHPLDVHLRAIFFAGGVVTGYPPVGFACSNQYSQNE